MYKTLHRTLGRAPRSYADYERLFSPDTRPNGWARGDGASLVKGNGWSLWSFNDTYRTGLSGIANSLIRNTLLLVMDNGECWWLSSGGGEPYPTASSFPPIDINTWTWTIGGYKCGGSDNAMMLAAGWIAGSPYTRTGYHAAKFTNMTADKPPNPQVSPVGLDIVANVSWSGVPFVDNGYIYWPGIHFGELSHYLARHVYTEVPSELATGWQYWAGGSNWSSNISGRVAVSIGSPPLRALSCIKWNGKYLWSAKPFDDAPEIATEPDDYPDLYVWESTAVFGTTLTARGVAARVSKQGWYAYGGRVEELPGVPGITAVYSLNTAQVYDTVNYIYGPHFLRAKYGADVSRSILYVGSGERTITTTDFNGVGVTGEPTRTWNKANGYEQVVNDAAATYLLTQPDFVDEVGIGIPESIDLLMADGNLYCQQLGTLGAARTLNAAQYRYYAGTLSANCTFTLTGGVVGEAVSRITIYIKQDPAVARTVTFSPTVKWAGGVAYAASTGLSALDKVELESTDGGTTWRGTYWKGYA